MKMLKTRSWIDFKAMWKTVCVYRPLVVTDVTQQLRSITG